MPIQIIDAAVIVNNEAVGIVPNSLVYTEGEGEQKMRAMSVGGGGVEQVFSKDLETSFSMVKFSMPTTVENIKLAKRWKTNGNANVVQLAASTLEGDMTRTFTQAALTPNYEVNIGTETDIEIEFESNSAI